jgi:cyclophilin family peptidyl-prolyl cis-trans isomerase
MSSRKPLFLVLAIALLASCTGKEALKNETPDEFPKIVFNTTEGSFTMQLLTGNAPKTCKEFVKWCKGEPQKDGNPIPIYQGLNFYNVEPGFFIQTGDPFNTGLGTPTHTIQFEKTFKVTTKGSVFLPSGGLAPNSSIFCILLADNPRIGENSTTFAMVTQGLEVCEQISQVPTVDNEKAKTKTPQQPVKIISVQVIEE